MIRRGEHNEITIVLPKIPVTLAMDGKAILINIDDIKRALRCIALAAISAVFSDAEKDKADETVDELANTVLASDELESVTSDAYGQLFADEISRAVTARIAQIEAGDVEKN